MSEHAIGSSAVNFMSEHTIGSVAENLMRIEGNELANKTAKQAAKEDGLEVPYNRKPKSTIVTEIEEKGSTNGRTTGQTLLEELYVRSSSHLQLSEDRYRIREGDGNVIKMITGRDEEEMAGVDLHIEMNCHFAVQRSREDSVALARFLATKLQPLTEEIKSNIKDSGHFIEIIDKIKLQDGDLLVSFDITSLFTNVPVNEATYIIHQKVIAQDLPTEWATLAEFYLQ
ncbi:hypothetical protein ANN_02889 [Periplaneta americana]|uniref:Reverse transcriptase domain-containing protein n=1 Tax=Periplaneta americana TaxID=6978 RepID=A0ABQ8U0L0_PERAM|nr:hypothetical protein ANN_02889 [Periplaneta americana]